MSNILLARVAKRSNQQIARELLAQSAERMQEYDHSESLASNVAYIYAEWKRYQTRVVGASSSDRITAVREELIKLGFAI